MVEHLQLYLYWQTFIFPNVPKSLVPPTKDASLYFGRIRQRFFYLVDSPPAEYPSNLGMATWWKLQSSLYQAKDDGKLPCYMLIFSYSEHRGINFYSLYASVTILKLDLRVYTSALYIDDIQIEISGEYQRAQDAIDWLANKSLSSMHDWGKIWNIDPPKQFS